MRQFYSVQSAIRWAFDVFSAGGHDPVKRYGEMTSSSTDGAGDGLSAYADAAKVVRAMMMLPPEQNMVLFLKLVSPPAYVEYTCEDLASFILHHIGRAQICKAQASYLVRYWARGVGGQSDYAEQFACPEKSFQRHRVKVSLLLRSWELAGLDEIRRAIPGMVEEEECAAA